MAVRSPLPWPLRWAFFAIVVGFCAAIALWAFEFGRDIAGLDGGTKEQLQQALKQIDALRIQLDELTHERDKAQSVANTADTVLTTEKVAQEKLLILNRQLELDNQRLKDDLGFFEQLIPTAEATLNAGGTLAIRGLQAEVLKTGEVKWQVLVIQAAKDPVEFKGLLEVVFAGVSHGKPWTGAPPQGAQPVKLKQYGRLTGLYQVPAQVELRSVTVKVLDGKTVKAVETVKIK